MSILVHAATRILVQGLTGRQAQSDTAAAIRYGALVVGGVTPGRGGESVGGVPVFDTVRAALLAQPAEASVIYAPPLAARDAALEAIAAGLDLVLVTAEGVPEHDILRMVATARRAGTRLVGCNTNGVISPGRSRLGGIGGPDPDAIYAPGRIGICSRSGGMSAELALALKAAGLGVSTCVSMGGDSVTGTSMAEIACLFEDDAETDAVVLFGEPGTAAEHEVAALVRQGRLRKPIVALIAGSFQERHARGRAFGHAAAMIATDADTASAKQAMLRAAGVRVAETLDEIPALLAQAANG
jgi:succinyl-CoA synthetase alpha subunit